MPLIRALKRTVFISLTLFGVPVLHGENLFVEEKLANGLELIAFPSHKVPLATIVLTCKGGAMTESPGSNGLTHLWEHMFFKGNEKLPNQEAFKKRIRTLGITYNGDTSAEKVRYFFTLPSVYLVEGLDFMADAIATPLIDEQELTKERKVVLDEWDRNASQPEFDFYNLQRSILYQEQGFLRDPLGDYSVIAEANRAQLMQIKKDIFVPQNCALIVGGDFEYEDLKAKAEKSFSIWTAPKEWKAITPPSFPKFTKTIDFVMFRPHIDNASVELTFMGPYLKETPKDTYIADILASLLQHKSGKFYRKFVDSGLTLGASFSYFTQSQTGESSFYLRATPENILNAKKSLLAEISAMAKPDYFSSDQLDDVKRSLIIDHKREINAPSSFTKTLAFWWPVTGLAYYQGYVNNMNQITLSDVQDFVKKYLINKPYLAGLLISEENGKKIKLKDTSKPFADKWLKKRPQTQKST